ncbi:MAG: DUF3800 domain-containing protein [candidate division KSB1 bacterium]
MLYLYLDESGDLGDLLQSPGTSRHFVIAILEINGDTNKKAIEKAITRTLRNKLHGKHPRHHNHANELKAAKTVFAIKEYFYRQVAAIPFKLYAVILDKTRFVNQPQMSKKRIYQFITHLVLKELPLDQAADQIILAVDRSMGGSARREFNEYLFEQSAARIPPHVPFSIYHDLSHENRPLQAVDLFAWGIYQKYEEENRQWYDLFQEKIVYEQVYPHKQKESDP